MNKSMPLFALMAVIVLSVFVTLKTSADADNGRQVPQPCVGCDSHNIVARRDQLAPLHTQLQKEVAAMVAKAEAEQRHRFSGVHVAFAPQLGGRRITTADNLFVAIADKSPSEREKHLKKVIGARLTCVGWDATITKTRSDPSGTVYDIHTSPKIVCDKGQVYLTTFSCTEQWKRVGNVWKMISCKQNGNKIMFFSL